MSISSIGTQNYTGSPVVPAVKITWNGKTLVKDRDYTITCTNNINPGTATATIKGKGNFTGTQKKTFTIKKTAVSKVALNKTSATIVKGKTLTLTPTITPSNASKCLTAWEDIEQVYNGSGKAFIAFKPYFHADKAPTVSPPSDIDV